MNVVKRFADRKHAMWIALVLFALSQAMVLYLLGPARDGLVTLQTTIDPNAAYGVFNNWSVLEWEGYWNHLKMDFLHPFIYTFALGVALLVGMKRRQVSLRLPIGLALSVGSFDLLENIMHGNAALMFPDRIDWLFVVGGAAAMLKWSGALVCVVLATVWNFGPKPEG